MAVKTTDAATSPVRKESRSPVRKESRFSNGTRLSNGASTIIPETFFIFVAP
jgi:hypothetical protein